MPIEKPAYKRSTKPLKRIAIADVVGPKESKDHENLKISDEDIDKLFNSNCGYFEEVKNPEARLKAKEKATKNLTKPVSVNKDIPNNKKEATENKLEKTMPKNVKETAVKNSTKGEMETKISTASANVEDSNKLESMDVAESNVSSGKILLQYKELDPLAATYQSILFESIRNF